MGLLRNTKINWQNFDTAGKKANYILPKKIFGIWHRVRQAVIFFVWT